jgi:hypothetical protein
MPKLVCLPNWKRCQHEGDSFRQLEQLDEDALIVLHLLRANASVARLKRRVCGAGHKKGRYAKHRHKPGDLQPPPAGAGSARVGTSFEFNNANNAVTKLFYGPNAEVWIPGIPLLAGQC